MAGAGEGERRLALDAACLLVRRAGLEHLVMDVTGEELEALAHAGEELAKERAVLLVCALANQPRALAPFDGGASLREATKQAAFALSEVPGGR